MKNVTVLSLMIGLFFAIESGAVGFGKLTGYWIDESGSVIEVRREGDGLEAHMRSTRGLSVWTNGSMTVKGDEIQLVKRNNGKEVNETRAIFREDAATKLRWKSGAVWRKATEAEAKAALKKK